MKTLRKFIWPLSVSILILTVFSSCNDEENERYRELLFTVEKNTNPESVLFDYYNPDPPHARYTYNIITNNEKSELVLNCTNANEIEISQVMSQFETDPSFTPVSYTDSREGWTISVTNGNSLSIEFEEREIEKEESIYFTGTTLIISSKQGKDAGYTLLCIYRNLDGTFNPKE